ncbi:MAG TPA: DNA repair protein RecO [Candidatus Woesebacteria bacterium]|nr:DNA repair protein RecO [Candidatus Woesebacteria bacterium]
MLQRNFTAVGLVLKRVKVGETDVIITMLTQERGKLVCRAKGVRTLKSTKRSALQPGNIVRFHWLETKSLPLLTQALMEEDCSVMESTLIRMRQLSQLLELCERLFIESELEEKIFNQIVKLRQSIVQNRLGSTDVRTTFRSIITQLGYQDPEDSKYESIGDYISALSDKPMRSYNFLSVKG